MDADFLKELKRMADIEIPENASTNDADDFSNTFSTDSIDRYSKVHKDNLQKGMLLDIEASYPMPAYLKEQIIERTKQPDIQPMSSKRKRSKKLELFLYSCKVSAAVAASLVIIITVSVTQGKIADLPQQDTIAIERQQRESTTNDNLTREHTLSEQDFSKQSKISEKINKSSESITNWLQDFPGNLFEQEK